MSDWETVGKAEGWETLPKGGTPQSKHSPETLQAVDDIKKRGWGTGLDRLAYDVGGRVTDFASKFLPPEMSALLGFTANVGTQAVPVLLGGELGKAAAPAFDKAAHSIMRSALKPTLKDVHTGRADKAIEVMLRERANVSPSGVEKLADKVAKTNAQIGQEIAGSTATISPGAAASRAQDVVDAFKAQVAPGSDLKAIQDVVGEFLTRNQGRIPVQAAQEIKQGTYRVLAKKYGQLGSASEEAQKAIARGLKEEIASAVPNVSGLNKLESELLDALKVATRRVAVEGNKNPVGITHLAPNSWQWLAGMLDRSAPAKSILAHTLNMGQQQIPATVGRVGGGLLGSYIGQPPQEYLQTGILGR